MSHVDYKKWLCRNVDFKKGQCCMLLKGRRVNFRGLHPLDLPIYRHSSHNLSGWSFITWRGVGYKMVKSQV